MTASHKQSGEDVAPPHIYSLPSGLLLPEAALGVCLHPGEEQGAHLAILPHFARAANLSEISHYPLHKK